jgi:hypothetical protein
MGSSWRLLLCEIDGRPFGNAKEWVISDCRWYCSTILSLAEANNALRNTRQQTARQFDAKTSCQHSPFRESILCGSRLSVYQVHLQRPRAQHPPTSIAWQVCARTAAVSVPCQQRYCWWWSRHGCQCEDERAQLSRRQPCWVRRHGGPKCLHGRIHCQSC